MAKGVEREHASGVARGHVVQALREAACCGSIAVQHHQGRVRHRMVFVAAIVRYVDVIDVQILADRCLGGRESSFSKKSLNFQWSL